MKRLVLTIAIAQIFLGGVSLQAYKPAETILMSREEVALESCDETESTPHVDIVAHERCQSDACVLSYECPSSDDRSLAANTDVVVLKQPEISADDLPPVTPCGNPAHASTYPETLLSVVLRV